MILNQKTYMKKHIIKQLISKQKEKMCIVYFSTNNRFFTPGVYRQE